MVILFSFDSIVKPSTFGLGLTAPGRPARRSPFTSLDQAWHAGFSAGQEDGALALPPADMDDDQTFAWLQGRESAVLGSDESDPSDPAGWDSIDEKAEAAMFMDAVACGFYHA